MSTRVSFLHGQGILRDLILHGPRRYQDFQESLEGIAPNTLSARLKALEAAGP